MIDIFLIFFHLLKVLTWMIMMIGRFGVNGEEEEEEEEGFAGDYFFLWGSCVLKRINKGLYEKGFFEDFG